MTTLDAKTLRHLLASWQPADALVAADMVEEFGEPAATLLTAKRYEGVRDAQTLRDIARLQGELCLALLRQNRRWLAWWEGVGTAPVDVPPTAYYELLLADGVSCGGDHFLVESIGSVHEMSVEVRLVGRPGLGRPTGIIAWLQRRLIDDGTARRSYVQRRAWGLARDVWAWAEGGADE